MDNAIVVGDIQAEALCRVITSGTRHEPILGGSVVSSLKLTVPEVTTRHRFGVTASPLIHL